MGQYVVHQHAATLGGRRTREKVSVTGKESSKYAPHGSTANHTQSAPTRTANMKGKAGSEDGWSKDRETKHPGSEGDGAVWSTASARQLRSQDHAVRSPVATRYNFDSETHSTPRFVKLQSQEDTMYLPVKSPDY